ncbi:MAG TPA: hypothetical protein VM513_28215 [Kofleriaceae bacterium]|nr:hypothetical protein [Kofleriaceae bacterium]
MSERDETLNVDILSDSELTTLDTSSGDDVDMALVHCVVRELRARRQADLTAEERDDLVWLRKQISVCSCGECRGLRALAAIDKLIAGAKP